MISEGLCEALFLRRLLQKNISASRVGFEAFHMGFLMGFLIGFTAFFEKNEGKREHLHLLS